MTFCGLFSGSAPIGKMYHSGNFSFELLLVFSSNKVPNYEAVKINTKMDKNMRFIFNSQRWCYGICLLHLTERLILLNGTTSCWLDNGKLTLAITKIRVQSIAPTGNILNSLLFVPLAAPMSGSQLRNRRKHYTTASTVLEICSNGYPLPRKLDSNSRTKGSDSKLDRVVFQMFVKPHQMIKHLPVTS